MGSPTRRRIAVAIVLVAAIWALVATTPPSTPEQTVEGVNRVAIPLTNDSPVGVVGIAIQASDESLWSDDPEVIPREARLLLQAHVPRPRTIEASPSATSGPVPILSVRLVLDGREMVRLPASSLPAFGEDPDYAEFDLRTVCPEDRDCDLALEAYVEWLNPTTGGELDAELVITASATLEGPEAAPAGAEMSIVAEAAEAAQATIVGDTESAAAVQLDAEQPMVTWTVDLEANAAAMAQALEWPVEQRSVLSVHADMPEAGGDDHPLGPPVRLLLIGAGEDMELSPAAGTLQTALPLLDCAQVGEACPERITLVATWLGETAADAVTVGWDLDAGITYHDPALPAVGAAITVGEPSRTDIHSDGPSVTATVSGSIPVVDEESPVLARTVRIGISEDALEADLVGGPVAAVLALVTASSTSSRPIPDDTAIRLRTSGEESLVPYPFEPATSWHAWAVPDCRAGSSCLTGIGLFGDAYHRDGGLEGTDLTIHWSMEVRVLYPRGASPPDAAEINVTVGTP